MRARFLIGLGLVHWAVSLGGAAYLGVSVARTPPPERASLSLVHDTGLTVRAVAANSPAAAAGLETEDILIRFDDQWLYSMEQLAALLRGRSPEDRLALERVRQGSSESIEVTLGQVPPDPSPPPMVRVATVPFSRWRDPAQRQRLLEEILRLGERHQDEPPADGSVESPAAAAATAPEPPALERENLMATVDAKAELVIVFARQSPDDIGPAFLPAPLPPPIPAAPWLERPTRPVAAAADDLTLLIETAGGRREVTFVRQDGAVLYRGPIDTEEDRMRLPPALRQRALEVFDPVDWSVRSSALPDAIEFHRLDALPTFL